jgi:hypothetical protein
VVSNRTFFIILVACAIACGCSQSVLQPFQTGAVDVPRHHDDRVVPIRTLFITVGHRGWWGWANPKTLRPYPKGFEPKGFRRNTEPSFPAATPTPGFISNCVGNDYCDYIAPGYQQGTYTVELWASCPYTNPSCTTVTINYVSTLSPGVYTPPPGFSVQGESLSNLGSWQNCSTGCSITTCPGATNCGAAFEYGASSTTPVANTSDYISQTGVGVAANLYWTVLPSVWDEYIGGGAQMVSTQFCPFTSPSPIVVGQQVKLQASPSSLTGVQWAFDTMAPSSIVGDYTLKNSVGASGPTAVPAASISPVPTATNPVSFYWISTVGIWGPGLRYVRMTGSVAGITGPLFADVYYPVLSPGPGTLASAGPVVLATNYPNSGNPANCASPTTTIAVGTICTTRGIVWYYVVGTPPPTPGSIAMVQVINSYSVTASGTPSPNPHSTTGFGLDGVFPYVAPTPATAQWTATDAPGYTLKTAPVKCQTVTNTMSFSDYFMYQPNAGSTRSGSRLWVTLGLMTWNFSGTASSISLAPYSLVASKTVNPAPTYTPTTTLPTWTQLFPDIAFGC